MGLISNTFQPISAMSPSHLPSFAPSPHGGGGARPLCPFNDVQKDYWGGGGGGGQSAEHFNAKTLLRSTVH